MCTDARGDASFSRAGKECFHARTPGETRWSAAADARGDDGTHFTTGNGGGGV